MNNELTVEDIKALRVQADALLVSIKEAVNTKMTPRLQASGDYSLYELAVTQASIHTIEAKMWLGKMLEGIGNPFPAELADKSN